MKFCAAIAALCLQTIIGADRTLSTLGSKTPKKKTKASKLSKHPKALKSSKQGSLGPVGPTTDTTYFDWRQLGSDIHGYDGDDQSVWSVSLSDDGRIVAIGVPGGFTTDPMRGGHVRVYKYEFANWSQLGSDIDGEANNDGNGVSVSLSADGQIVGMGAPGNDVNGLNSGHVRIFKYEANDWSQVGSDIDGKAGDKYGSAISLSSDGSIVAISSIGNEGHVSIFKYESDDWFQQGSSIYGEAAGDRSGFSLSLSSDGSIVAIGAVSNDVNGNCSGHARVFKYESNMWLQLGSNIDGEGERDGFGYSISMSSDGSIVAIGAVGHDGIGQDSGYVRVFKYASNAWRQLGSDIVGQAAGDNFGASVSLSHDGLTAAIGAPLNDFNGQNSGLVDTFKFEDDVDW
eukprot:CAMPEP_0184857344 /NCGR_PEP_ID=MMETSP0580-20130426/2511_1 /TAXON_ID=1118495 /ORGANISM="Dactyliosolen fragilissimus" /LENGTH=399 /DNA_ID=CAMNT_0027352901 /DNA_START=210 /DNA_END=1406 /DNA_ORIENTATION=+